MPALFPFAPTTPTTETLETATDVLRAYTAEQQIALRRYPRQVLNYSFTLSALDMARLENLVRTDGAGDWYVPIWHEGARVSDIASAATSVSLTTTWADYRANGYALIWESNSKAQVVQIQSVGASSLTLTGAVGADYTAPFVAPVRTAYVDGVFNVSPTDATHGTASATFVVTDNADKAAAEYDLYSSLRVVTTAPLVVRPIEHMLGQRFEYVDSGLGTAALEQDRSYFDAMFQVTFRDEGAEARWRRRRFVHNLRGRQGEFWLPTYRRDLVVVSNIGAADTSIVVTGTNDSDGYSDRHILIMLEDGTRFYREITGVAGFGANNTLNISSALGQAVTTAQIRLVCFMSKVRMDADTVRMEHHVTGYTDTSMMVIETP